MDRSRSGPCLVGWQSRWVLYRPARTGRHAGDAPVFSRSPTVLRFLYQPPSTDRPYPIAIPRGILRHSPVGDGDCTHRRPTDGPKASEALFTPKSPRVMPSNALPVLGGGPSPDPRVMAGLAAARRRGRKGGGLPTLDPRRIEEERADHRGARWRRQQGIRMPDLQGPSFNVDQYAEPYWLDRRWSKRSAAGASRTQNGGLID